MGTICHKLIIWKCWCTFIIQVCSYLCEPCNYVMTSRILWAVQRESRCSGSYKNQFSSAFWGIYTLSCLLEISTFTFLGQFSCAVCLDNVTWIRMLHQWLLVIFETYQSSIFQILSFSYVIFPTIMWTFKNAFSKFYKHVLPQ